MLYAVYKIEWTEYERGWGSRPDGVSYHKTKALAEQYRQEFIGKQPSGPVPDEYTSPGPVTLVEVDKTLYNHVQKKKVVWKN